MIQFSDPGQKRSFFLSIINVSVEHEITSLRLACPEWNGVESRGSGQARAAHPRNDSNSSGHPSPVLRFFIHLTLFDRQEGQLLSWPEL